MEVQSEEARYRQLSGIPGRIARITLILLCVVAILFVLDVQEFFGLSFYIEQYFGIMFTLSFVAGFLIIPAGKGAAKNKLPWYDAIFALASLVSCGYIIYIYPAAAETLGVIMPERVILGAIMVVLGLELCRRLFGIPLLVVVIVLILYARFTDLVPGMLGGRGISWEYLITLLYLSPSGILGSVSHVVFTMVLGFVFFGQVALHTGGGEAITNFALAGMGRFRGGPAKVAVVASGMFGSISGSPVANVITTGTITIPMMKRIGYSPTVAGAVEAVASTGGSIMPPVMGAAAFIIAEFLRIPYAAVALAAVVPGILYYVTVFVQVDLEAAKTGLKGLPKHQLPSLVAVIRANWMYVVPAVVLVYALFVMLLAPAKAAVLSAAAFFLVSAFNKETRITVTKMSTLLEGTGKLTLEIAAVVIVSGIAIAVVGVTGAGVSFSRALTQLSGGNIYLLLLLAALSSTILGMGMNATATYIIVAVLTAPALIQLGVDPLAAHLFVFYFGSLSMITPPVCVAVYPASVIAGSPIMRTGLEAVKIGIVAFIVPFVFALDPALLLMGDTTAIAIAIAKSVVGFVCLSAALQGYIFSRISPALRVLLGLGAFGTLLPNLYLVNLVGFGIVVAIVVLQWMAKTRRAEQYSPSS